MKIRLLTWLLCAVLSLSPGAAYYVALPERMMPTPADVMVACLADTTDATTYNPVAWQSLSTGRADEDAVSLWVGVIGEDGVITFGVNSVSVDAAAFTEVVDEDGSGLINSALYRANNNGNTASYIKNTAQVNVSVTFSEAVTGAAVCVFTIKGTDVSGAGPGNSVTADDDTASGAVILTNAGSLLAGKVVIGVCGSQDAAVTTTWTGLTEQTDAASAEFAYSSAYLVVPNGSVPGTLTINCDYSGAGDATGVQSASGP
jgi:hypothetical protein